jgi:16S rRNA (guanine1207-N2)-methyltransferase
MEHYYTRNTTVEHDLSNIEFRVGEGTLTLTTDSGVFSKKKVDFGSMLLIEKIPHTEGKILDMGCGYGPVGLSLALINPKSEVTMVDINERAVGLANQNAQTNKLLNAKAIQSDGYELVNECYDIIVSNPPIRTGKKVIYPMFEQSIDHLNEGGQLYIVIQKKQGADSAIKKLTEVYGNCVVIAKDSGYCILLSCKIG